VISRVTCVRSDGRSSPTSGRPVRASAVAAVIVSLLLLASVAASASAAEFNVNSTADTTGCASTCSLRGAIEAADVSTDATSTVTVPAGVYDLLPAEKANPDHVGQLRLTNPTGTTVRVIGAGAGNTIVNAGKGDRVLRVGGDGSDVLEDMTLEGGFPNETDGTPDESVRGAGILQTGSGKLTLKRMLLDRNQDNGWGGGVDVEGDGTLELIESELTDDVSTSGGGGGVSLEPGALIATASSLDADDALGGTGGALQLLEGSAATLTNDTFAQDGFLPTFGDTYEGGAVFVEESSATFTNVTFSDDSAFGSTHGGADISANEGSRVMMRNTLLGAPTGGEIEEHACNEVFDSVTSTWEDLGGNLSADTTCHLAAPDMGIALGLGLLGENGGPTQTVPLLAGSPAINNGVEGCPTTDQRGYARVGICDSGAYEFGGVPAEEPKATTTETSTTATNTKTAEHETVAPGQTAEQAEHVLLGCGNSKLVLSDVYPHGRRVVIRGSAAKSLAGKRVRILLNGAQQVATALVGQGGEYATSAPLPVLHGHVSASARYVATLGTLRSLNLKLTRRLELEAPTSSATTVVLSGHVEPPLTRPVSPVAIERELECGKPTTVASFTPPRSGHFHITVSVPAGTSAAIFRLRSTVAANARSPKHGFATFSLPLPVQITPGS
jgi:CSLREA domain-containing protein